MQVALLCVSEAQARGTSSRNILLAVSVPGILALLISPRVPSFSLLNN